MTEPPEVLRCPRCGKPPMCETHGSQAREVHCCDLTTGVCKDLAYAECAWNGMVELETCPPCPRCGKQPAPKAWGDSCYVVGCCGMTTTPHSTRSALRDACTEWRGRVWDYKQSQKTVSHRSVLDEAAAIVEGARRDSYGTPAENHGRTAALWSAYLGVEITARQVCMLNILQKISRDAHRPHRDGLVDIAGYALNAELVGERP